MLTGLALAFLLAFAGGPADPPSLQSRLNAAAAGAVIDVAAGTYAGDLIIDRPLTLVGHGRPRLVGSGHGSVVTIVADDVVIEGFEIDDLEGGDLARDSSGIHIAAKHVTVRDCHIIRSLFGVYLREADGATVERVTIEGIAGKSAGEQGSGVHVYNTNGFTLTGNHVRDSRDGIYIQSSPHGLVRGNVVTDVRYGLHYMFSDDNTFEDNLFERSAAGAAVMYSHRLTFTRNRFLRNRGYASVGLLLQGCDSVTAEDNLIADNARGIFLEAAHHQVIRRNIIADSDIAIVLYASSSESRFEENSFVGNLSPLQLVGKRTDTVFDRNFWSDAEDPDLDGDGLRDAPYRLSNVFDHFRGNLTAADLFAQGLGATVLSAAERAFPVLDPIAVVDAHPLAAPPRLPMVPPAPVSSSHGTAWGLTTSALALVGGIAVLGAGRRPRVREVRS